MKQLALISLAFLLLGACHKKKSDDPAEEPPITEPTPVDSGIKCQELPPPPGPFGWNDSTFDYAQSITAFLFNPVNSDEVICLAKGDITGFNQLFTYNVITKTRIPLANIGEFLPSINKRGWVVFSSVENNVFRIKTNGDSLIQITSTQTCIDPKWSPSGNCIYYFQQAFANVTSCIVRLNIWGSEGSTIFPADLPFHAVFRKSEQVIYLKPASTQVSLVQKNMETQVERELISGPYNSKSEQIFFDDLCLDNTDENFYWSNTSGVFKCNLNTLKVDTLLKNCPNYTYGNPLMSFSDGELTVGMQVLKPLGNSVLLHEYKAMQYNFFSQKIKEIKIFP